MIWKPWDESSFEMSSLRMVNGETRVFSSELYMGNV